MTQPSLLDAPVTPPRRPTFTDRVEQYFRQRPGRWIGSLELEQVGGRCAWRTRVSECRAQRGMPIQNRQRTVDLPDGSACVVSEYRYQPQEQR